MEFLVSPRALNFLYPPVYLGSYCKQHLLLSHSSIFVSNIQMKQHTSWDEGCEMKYLLDYRIECSCLTSSQPNNSVLCQVSGYMYIPVVLKEEL